MWPTLKESLHDFLFDKTFFVRAMRSFIATMAASGLAFSDQIASAIGAPHAAHVIKVIAIICTGLSLMLGAGDKTPENVKALAQAEAQKALTGP